MVKNIFRKSFVLPVLLSTLIAGCVGQGGDVLKSLIDVPLLTASATEDVNIYAQVPEFARQNREFNWHIVVQPSIDIKNFAVDIYDACKFEDKSNAEEKSALKNPQEIKANHTKIYTLTYSLGMIDFEGECEVRFKTSHKATATASTTVIALSDTEWQQRKARGTLSALPINTYVSSNPLKVEISWSEDPRFLDQSTIQMYVEYRNAGSGSIKKLESKAVNITLPKNLELADPNCDDYSYDVDKRELILVRSLDFIAKKAKRSTCTFKTKAAGDIDSQSIVATADYVYETDNSVKIPMLKK